MKKLLKRLFEPTQYPHHVKGRAVELLHKDVKGGWWYHGVASGNLGFTWETDEENIDRRNKMIKEDSNLQSACTTAEQLAKTAGQVPNTGRPYAEVLEEMDRHIIRELDSNGDISERHIMKGPAEESNCFWFDNTLVPMEVHKWKQPYEVVEEAFINGKLYARGVINSEQLESRIAKLTHQEKDKALLDRVLEEITKLLEEFNV